MGVKLCRGLLAKGDLAHAESVLNDLHNLCRLMDGTDDRTKGSELLEVYALKVQLLEAQDDSVKLKELFTKTKDLSAEIRDPRSMSVIQVLIIRIFRPFSQSDLGMLGKNLCQ